jgi:hypothetical protein
MTTKCAAITTSFLWALVVAGAAGVIAANVTFRTPTALELEAGVEHLKGGTGVQWEWVVSASAILGALAGLCKYLWYSTQPERE